MKFFFPRAFGLVLTTVCALSFYSPSFAQEGQDDRTAGAMPGQVSEENDTYKQLNLFGDVFERVRAQYVDEVPDKQLVENALNGMLTALDPHSSYLNENDFKDMQVQTRGEFGGLGIEVTMENGVVKVVSPIDDTPAARAGVKPGDLITHLDDQPIVGLSLNEAVDKMRGKVGTSIKLTIHRDGADEPVQLTLMRDVIKINSVKHEVLDGNIGYMRITTFNQNTDEGLRKAIKDIQEKTGKKLLGYILDLRNNPGGLLDQAIAVSDDFIDKGEIVSTRGRHEEDTKRDNATPGDLIDGMPLAVLINGGSASASEIVSGALQDHRRAILLGTRSFGKGSVQTIIPLPGNGAIRLTTARYYTPSGRSIQAKGIDPDIMVEQAKLEKMNSENIHEADLRGALANPDDEAAKKAGTKPAEEEKPEADKDDNGESKAQDKEKGKDQDKDQNKDKDKSKDQSKSKETSDEDYQLSRAKDLIHGISLYGTRAMDMEIEPDAGKPSADVKTEKNTDDGKKAPEPKQ